MKKLKKDLKAIIDDLDKISQKTNSILSLLEELNKTHTAKPPVLKIKAAAKKAANTMTAIDSVMNIIKKSRTQKGVNTAVLMEKTGFNEKKIWNVINSLKKKGKIKSVARGFYIKI